MTAATLGLVVFVSSSTAAIQFIMLGHIPIYYAAIFGPACMLASLAGVVLVSRAVRRFGRPSIIVMTLAVITVMCTGEA